MEQQEDTHMETPPLRQEARRGEALPGRKPGTAALPEPISILTQMSAPLLAWYDRGHRQLPWRQNPSPYRVWVSEIMLQQTRVEAVRPYFERFMQALPGILDLAQASDETLLKLWEGLGYYNRVRNMKKAAEIVRDRYGGEMPQDYEELLRLPGIGSYTAGAIASIAFGQAVPAVDGNVLRVVMRVLADRSDIALAGVKKAVERDLLAALPAARPGDFNQAVMELGATVCLPNGAPKCEDCPLCPLCRAYAAGAVRDYPVRTPQKSRRIEEKTVLLLWDADRVAMRQRPKRGLLAGLYEFPWLEGFRESGEVLRYLKERGLQVLRIRELPPCRHIFTHKEWHMKGYSIRVDELESQTLSGGLLFVDAETMRHDIPIPSAFAPFAAHMYAESRKETENR